MGLIIGADTVPTAINMEIFREADVCELLGNELISEFLEAEKVILNLETPLTDDSTPIKKAGPCLVAPVACAGALKKMGVDIVSLANNHIMDQGEQGLISTLKALSDNEIDYLGVGDDLKSVKKSIVVNLNNRKIGIYSCAETEFSIATEQTPGANPFDPMETFDHISDLKKECDYVVTLYHGGREHYRYPSPELKKKCHKLVEKGADLVICQHSHCIGCEEKYLDSTIVYGQGNFLFDMCDEECWKTGLLIKINDDFTITYVPLIHSEGKVRKANNEEAREIMDDFYIRSEEIKDDLFVRDAYEKLAKDSFGSFISRLYGKRNFAFRLINKLSGYRFGKWWLKNKYSDDYIRAIRNVIECEAHRELFLAELRKR